MEKIQVDNALIRQFKNWFSENEPELAKERLLEMYPQDIAMVIDRLTNEEARLLMNFLQKEKVIRVLVEMEDSARESFLSAFTPFEIANEFIENMDSDDAVYVLNHFSTNVKEDIIGQLQDIEYASSLLSLINYDENTAGSLMAVELVKVQ